MDNIQDLYMNNSCFLAKTIYLDRISLSVFTSSMLAGPVLWEKNFPFFNPLGSIKFIIW